MPGKIKITPGQPVGLKPIPDEREAILDMPWRDDTLKARIQQRSADQRNLRSLT